MKKLLSAVVLLTILWITGCDTTEKQNYTGDRLADLFNGSLMGDSAGMAFTKEIFDSKLPPPGKSNLIKVDSIITDEGAKYFSVLIEFSNPVYNRFCIYDSLYRLMLVDKSLNGYISMKPIDNPAVDGFEVTEMFDSKDSIKLKRGSLYILRGDTFELSFRKFTEMRLGNNYLSQTINVMTPKVLSTKLLSSKNIQLRFYEDTFLYDTDQNSYFSGEDILNRKIYEFIYNYRDDTTKQYIRDAITAMKSTGMNIEEDTVSLYNNYKDVLAKFSIFLPNGWLFKKNVLFSHNLKKALVTTHFYNGDNSANFYVTKLKKGEMTDDYLLSQLDKVLKGDYQVRYAEKVTVEKMYCHYYEFICAEMVFLIIVETDQSAYERNKPAFDGMVKSFAIDC